MILLEIAIFREYRERQNWSSDSVFFFHCPFSKIASILLSKNFTSWLFGPQDSMIDEDKARLEKDAHLSLEDKIQGLDSQLEAMTTR